MNMKSYQPYLTAVLLFLLAGSTAGCFDELVEPTYDGPPKSQFFPTSATVLDGSGVASLNVQLIGPHQSEAIEIPVTVVDTGGLTTASPDNYDLLTETFEIPAESSFGEVRVDVQPGGIPPGESRQLTLALEESTDGEVVPATNFRFFKLTITGREADVSVDPTSITFDSTAVGMTVMDTVTIANGGNLETEISGLAVVDDTTGSFAIVDAPADPFTLEAGESAEVAVEFTPAEEGVLGAQLSFMFTNDPDAEELVLGLEGTGFDPDAEGEE